MNSRLKTQRIKVEASECAEIHIRSANGSVQTMVLHGPVSVSITCSTKTQVAK
jgi:hypothetical protein